MSPETLGLLSWLLDQMQLDVGHAEFETRALQVIAAKRELAEAVSATATE